MIGKEDFIRLINEYHLQDKRIDALNELIPDSFGAPILDFGWKMFDEVKKVYFTEEGVDWIDYYLYENPERRYYVGGVAYPLDTIDDLWNLIKEYRK